MKLVPAVAAALLASAASLAATPAAETLPEALAEAYETNPQLTVQRDIVRQADEGVPQALAAGRPTLNATGIAQQSAADLSQDGGRYYQGALSLNQSLYRGGPDAAPRSAPPRTASTPPAPACARSRTPSCSTSSPPMPTSCATPPSSNSTRTRSRCSQRELQANRDRFEVGDLTRTDVAQSDARLANAQSNLVVAQGQLNTARNAYLRVVGHYPGDARAAAAAAGPAGDDAGRRSTSPTRTTRR